MPRRVGRPGLLGTMARTAVITGTASATSRAMNNRANARADQRASAQAYDAQQAQHSPAATPADDTLSQLQKLGEMRSAGLLTDAEFAAAKAKILG
ncbi:SHOCT domain-containing protein [Isoptericola halotolerans]|uniref:SHOCT domain-containing protein n=1 Tax=Isoptericola halotolerans TaxID=300560 RepID=UPI003890B8F8